MNRRSLLVSGLTALAFPLTAFSAQQGKSFALLIGVEQYDSPDIARLNFAVTDVTAVGTALRESLGFGTVRLLTSDTTDARLKPTNVNVFKALDNLATEIGPEDTFVLYFSGHGFSKEGQNFLGSINADPSSVETLSISSVPVATLQSKLKKIKAKQVILIMDACRNDPEAGKGEGDNKLTSDFAKTLGVVARAGGGEGSASAVLFACSEGERAFEEPSFGHSVFTKFLLEGLSGKAASLSLEDVTAYTAGEVKKWAKERGKKQTPDYARNGTGKLVFSTKVIAAAEPAPIVEAARVAKKSFRASLVFKNAPAGAVIKVNGAVVSGGSYGEDLTESESKSVSVLITARGFKADGGEVVIKRGVVSEYDVRLEPEPIPDPVVPAGKVKGSRKTRKGNAEMCFVPGNGTIADFWMDATPVTVAQYKAYCAATGKSMPKDKPSWDWIDDHPMVYVSGNEASAFATWAGGRLPTSAEFEYAARDGGRNIEYPWGNDAPSDQLWWTKTSDDKGTAPVKRSSNIFVNSHGLSDMAGNVWQWCSDGPDSASRYLKGGSWVDEYAVNFRCVDRFNIAPTNAYDSWGFRLLHPGL
ncbi:MAG: SUMF1/EgtB/PvdO family nonheme iron enzyme [Armatimonadetes bacterium]|nr:SUMF1/EgtB/PvdO family nonheme iron enzyme [Armatimonadota bacterium]